MANVNPAFIPGSTNTLPGYPLGRFLPPLLPGMVKNWLSGQAGASQPVEPDSWVLDPFGTHPLVAIEAAQAGYRVLVTVNNPVTRFMLEILACAPQMEDFQAAFSDLAAARKGDERLEKHLSTLYETNCSNCGQSVPVQAFLWENESTEGPYGRLYTCPSCGDSGEQPVTESDLSRLQHLPPAGLHRARALEKVASIDDPIRQDVEEAIQVYLPRSLYVIFTLINKLDTLPLQPGRRALLNAMLLSALDDANTLWPYPAGSRARPKQLGSPPRFRENNLWNSLEQSAVSWHENSPSEAIPISVWPEKAPGGGITIYPGRYRDIAGDLSGEINIRSVVALFPRPNQAYWTLSALWSGWLWGREAAATLKSVLSRRRYDWSWHGTALQSVLEVLQEQLPDQTPVFGIVTEAEPQFLTAAAGAATQSGLEIQGINSREDPDTAQLFMATTQNTQHPASVSREALFRSAIDDLLQDLGEPATTLALTAAALAKLGKSSPAVPAKGQADIGGLTHLIRRILSDKSTMVRYGGSDQALENAQWWLREVEEPAVPLMDRVEMEVVHSLQKQPGISLMELDREICQKFTGPATPSFALIQCCLESYGKPDGPGWSLRPEDEPRARRSDLKKVQTTLVQIGKRLGYDVGDSLPVVWLDKDGQAAAVYAVSVSAHLDKYMQQNDFPPEIRWLVFPGGRAGLVAYKLDHNPRLRHAVSAGWRFIKFRRLFDLAHSPTLTRETWFNLAVVDPPVYQAPELDL